MLALVELAPQVLEQVREAIAVFSQWLDDCS
jgi:hypothetical protein